MRGGAVGEGEAQHVAVFNACRVGMHDAFGKDVGLAAPWRCQHQVSSTLYLNGFLLPRVEDALGGHIIGWVDH